MKKALAILVLFSYMLCAFGVSFNIHHCGGHFKYVTFKEKSEKKCCKKKVMPPGCCNDKEVKFKKSGDDLLAKQSALHFKTLIIAEVPKHYFYLPDNSAIFAQTSDNVVKNNSPPVAYSPPLYILYEAFLI